jgi:hypothetical protein
MGIPLRPCSGGFLSLFGNSISVFGRIISVFGFDRESARKVLKPPHEFANKSPHRVQKAKKSLLFSLLISASSAEASRAAS